MSEHRGYTLEAQIACAGREVAIRRSVYPKWVANGRMKAEAADHEINCMQAIVDTLKAQAIAERARTERLVAALREAGETAFRAMEMDKFAEPSACAKEYGAFAYRQRNYRQIVARLMAQWCREHGEDELATIFEREGNHGRS